MRHFNIIFAGMIVLFCLREIPLAFWSDLSRWWKKGDR